MKTMWHCTECEWQGTYKQTKTVMYHGIDWQDCPSCDAPCLPRVCEQLPNQEVKVRQANICNCYPKSVIWGNGFCGNCGKMLPAT
ncbi:MAG: hypothetical protein GY853_10095 [PVC group bacterium]|nr:hypothetical protein [PVC group bacterium]